MSRSSLWVMNNKYEGSEVTEFDNSWLFSPIVWSVLLDKYMNKEIQTPYGYKKSLIMNSELNAPCNDKINNCKCLPDRICWEMSNQQVFFTKDKVIISESIKEFVNINKQYDQLSNGKYPLQEDHIIKRFNEIADEILSLDENEHPYFIFKNTSCDDNVEYWFNKYNEDTEEYEEIGLDKLNKRVTEFVYIKNGDIEKFKSNTEYFNKEDT